MTQDVVDPKRRRQPSIISGVLPRGTCFLYGASGSGKTGVAISIALSTASGGSWAGREVSGGTVLYIAAEDEYGVRDRMVAASMRMGLDPSKLPLAIWEGPACGIWHPDWEEEVRKEIVLLGLGQGWPVLVVIDTFAVSYGDASQDEANAASRVMNVITRLAKRFGCCVLVIHHSAKGDGPLMRGSQVFHDRADGIIRAKRKGSRTTLEIQKMRNGPTEGRFSYGIGSHIVPTNQGPLDVQIIVDLREECTGAAPKADKRTSEGDRPSDIDVALDQLKSILAVHGVATLRAWQQACYGIWKEKTDGARSKAFSQAKSRLSSAGTITIVGETVTVTGT